MIPFVSMNVDPSVPVDAQLGLPAEDEIGEEGYGVFRNVWTIYPPDLVQLAALLDEERLLVSLIDEASQTTAEFEARAAAVEGGDPNGLPSSYIDQNPDSPLIQSIIEDDREAPLLALELGVSGLSHALTTAGCLTAASCRSHESVRSWSDCPAIFFAAERSTMDWLAPLIRDTGCGLSDGSDRGDRLLILVAPSIAHFMDLARSVYRHLDESSLSTGAAET
ncbi:hypothetical protein [Streptomyces tendae]|uniref:hypothetical protein n=1 Tax=Streptomyces tendae TaxID=1932 RepID=UPI00132FCF0C|nr:hypothetical protein [Streptomyces tendae]